MSASDHALVCNSQVAQLMMAVDKFIDGEETTKLAKISLVLIKP